MLHRAGITRIADVTGLDNIGIPVVMAVRPNSRSVSVAQGKGITLADARVSGAMEALETFHAERVDRPVYLLRWSELPGSDGAVDVERLPRCAGALRPGIRLPWIVATDLLSGKQRLVPLELVHTDFTIPRFPGAGLFPMSSNGLGSGNTYAEALMHALCELIERDAWVLSRMQPDTAVRAIDPETISDPILCDMLEGLSKAACSLTLRDLTSEIGVPVFAATITSGSDAPTTSAPALGFGCHPNPAWAAVRAISEAAQSRLTRLVGSRDDIGPDVYFSSPAAGQHSPPANGSVFSAIAGFLSDTVEEDLEWVIGRIVKHGFDEILAVDLGRAEFDLPVLRAIVPGLRHPDAEAASPSARSQLLR